MTTEQARAAMDIAREQHPIASYAGGFVGGLLLIAVLSIVLEKLIFQRVFDDPLKGKCVSVGVAWLIASIIGGFGMADGGPYAFKAFLLYGVAALPILFWFYRRGLTLREEAETTFD